MPFCTSILSISHKESVDEMGFLYPLSKLFQCLLIFLQWPIFLDLEFILTIFSFIFVGSVRAFFKTRLISFLISSFGFDFGSP
jgi:hypothetical protein